MIININKIYYAFRTEEEDIAARYRDPAESLARGGGSGGRASGSGSRGRGRGGRRGSSGSRGSRSKSKKKKGRQSSETHDMEEENMRLQRLALRFQDPFEHPSKPPRLPPRRIPPQIPSRPPSRASSLTADSPQRKSPRRTHQRPPPLSLLPPPPLATENEAVEGPRSAPPFGQPSVSITHRLLTPSHSLTSSLTPVERAERVLSDRSLITSRRLSRLKSQNYWEISFASSSSSSSLTSTFDESVSAEKKEKR